MRKIIFGLVIYLAVFSVFCGHAHASNFSFSRNLHFNSTGNDVTELQKLLIKDGYFKKLTSQYFGPVTLSALKDWQKANGLKVDGYFGPLSMTVANQEEGGVSISDNSASSISVRYVVNGALQGKRNVYFYASAKPGVSISSVKFVIDGTIQEAYLVNSVYTSQTFLYPGAHTVTAIGKTKKGTTYNSSQVAFQINSLGGGNVNIGSSGPAPVSVSINDPIKYIISEGTTTFNAQVQNTTNTAVTWSSQLGTIDASGHYVAPVVKVDPVDTITATSVADPTKSASVELNVNPEVLLNNPTNASNTTSTSYAFDGTAGEKVSLAVTGIDDGNNGCNTTGSIVSSDGVNIAKSDVACGGTLSLNNITLPKDDTYTTILDAGQHQVTTSNFILTTPATGTIPLNTPTTVPTTYPGQSIAYTFSGTAGEKINLAITNVVYAGRIWGLAFNVNNPDGTQLYGGNVGTNPVLTNQVLPQDGTYTVFLIPSDAGTVSATFTLSQNSAPIVLPLKTPTVATITSPGQTATLTFSGTAGEVVNLITSNITYSGRTWLLNFNITNPDGSQFFNGTVGTSPALTNQTLPQDGTYTISLTPYNDIGTGGVTFTLTQNGAPEADVTLPLNTPTVATITNPGQTSSLTFNGTAGEVVNLVASNSTYTGASWMFGFTITNPDGSQFFNGTIGTNPVLANQILSQDGVYTVSITSNDTGTGSVTFLLTNNPASVTLPLNTPTVATITYPGQTASLTFSGTAGEVVNFVTDTNAYSGASWRIGYIIKNPDGSEFFNGSVGTSPILTNQTLHQNGTYTVYLISYDVGGTGNITLTLTNNPAPVALSLNTPTVANIPSIGQTASLTFSGTAGEVVNLAVDSSAYAGQTWRVSFVLTSPSGSKLIDDVVYYAPFLNKTLPQDGTYTVSMTSFSGSGNLTVTLTNP